jgi:deazaflavin-dependent oxidoreductase (nitroreductase family)
MSALLRSEIVEPDRSHLGGGSAVSKTYRLTLPLRMINALMKLVLKVGVGPKHYRLLVVRGRKSGREYATPVNLVLRNGEAYLVSPYGEVSWVKNARPAGEVTLRRGMHSDVRRIEELDAAAAAPVLRDYWQQNPITHPYFDASPADPPDAFLAEAARHPVFRLVEPHTQRPARS